MEQNYVTVTLCITDITVELMIKMDFFDKSDKFRPTYSAVQ